jgi:hypothetical protein
MGHLRRWCPPEELKLDVVGVTEGEHGVLCVRRLLDARMPYSKEIETLGPLVQIRPLSDQELKVVQAGMSSLKGPWGPPSTRPGRFRARSAALSNMRRVDVCLEARTHGGS